MKPNTKKEFGLKSIFGENERAFGSFCHLGNGAAGGIRTRVTALARLRHRPDWTTAASEENYPPIIKHFLTNDCSHHSPTDHRTDREDDERYWQALGDGGAFCQTIVPNLDFRRIADEDDCQ